MAFSPSATSLGFIGFASFAFSLRHHTSDVDVQALTQAFISAAHLASEYHATPRASVDCDAPYPCSALFAGGDLLGFGE